MKNLKKYFDLQECGETKSEKLEKAIRAMINDGLLISGDSLPPQRDMADALGIALSVVSKALNSLKKCGIVYGERGRGSFIAFDRQFAHDYGDRFNRDDDYLAQEPAEIDESQPVLCNLVERLEFMDEPLPEVIDFGRFRPEENSLKHCGSHYLKQLGIRVKPEDVTLSHNAYIALWTAFQLCCPPGTVLAAPELSFLPLFRNRLVEGNVSMVPLACDQYGIMPEALDAACHSYNLKVLTCSPECELPTTRMMSRQRRLEIAELARRHDLTIIENNWLLPAGQDQELPALAMLAPERTIFLEHASKMLSCSSFCSFSYVPQELREKFIFQRNLIAGPIPLFARRITQYWLDSGYAERNFKRKNVEIIRRNELAREILSPLPVHTHRYARFCWLPLDKGQSAVELRMSLLKKNVLVSTAQNYLVGSVCNERGLLIGLCHEPSRGRLERALETIKKEVLK